MANRPHLPKGVLGRADLIMALARHPRGLPEGLDDLLGFQLQHREPLVEPVEEKQVPVRPVRGEKTEVSTRVQVPFAPVPFWQGVRHEVLPAPPPGIEDPHLRPDLPTRPESAAAYPFLASWATLIPRLRKALVGARPGRGVNVPLVVQRLSRAEILNPLPKQTRRGWGSTLYIIEDRSQHLVPYRRDQGMVQKHIKALYAHSGCISALYHEGLPEPGVLHCCLMRVSSARRPWQNTFSSSVGNTRNGFCPVMNNWNGMPGDCWINCR